MARKVYIVTGSEDGTLGIASGVQPVLGVARSYLGDRVGEQDWKALEMELYRTGTVTVVGTDGTSVTADAWELGVFPGFPEVTPTIQVTPKPAPAAEPQPEPQPEVVEVKAEETAPKKKARKKPLKKAA